MILRPLPKAPKTDPDLKVGGRKSPMIVNIANDPVDGGRILTIKLPQMKVYTEALRREKEEFMGADALAQCDMTGDLIFKDDNVNRIVSKREEFNDFTFSTKFMRLLVDAVRNPGVPQAERHEEARV